MRLGYSRQSSPAQRGAARRDRSNETICGEGRRARSSYRLRNSATRIARIRRRHAVTPRPAAGPEHFGSAFSAKWERMRRAGKAKGRKYGTRLRPTVFFRYDTADRVPLGEWRRLGQRVFRARFGPTVASLTLTPHCIRSHSYSTPSASASASTSRAAYT